MQRIGTHKYVRYPHKHQSINFCLGWIHTPYRHRYTHSHSLRDAGKVFLFRVCIPPIHLHSSSKLDTELHLLFHSENEQNLTSLAFST